MNYRTILRQSQEGCKYNKPGFNGLQIESRLLFIASAIKKAPGKGLRRYCLINLKVFDCLSGKNNCR